MNPRQEVLLKSCLKTERVLQRNRMGVKKLQSLYAKKFQEGNGGPDADTGKKTKRNRKGYKKNTQFQYFFGNIFLHRFIFTHECYSLINPANHPPRKRKSVHLF
jgi:hypothetical protein